MLEVKSYSDNYELYPTDNRACKSLGRLLSGIDRFEFTYSILDANVNQGQMTTDFDEHFEQAVLSQGATAYNFKTPADIPQQLDFAFRY